MLKRKENIVSLILVLAFSLVVIAMSLSLEYAESRIMPLFIGTVLTALVCVALFMELTRRGRTAGSETASGSGAEAAGSDGEPDESRLPICLAWLAGYAAGIWLLGFYAASFLFVLAYIRVNCGRWTEAVICAALCSAALVVFPLLFEIDLYTGVLWGLLSK